MTSKFIKFSLQTASALCAVLISGCAVQSYTPDPNAIMPASTINGKAMGGEQAIVGGLVSLYSTTTAPYGTGGQLLATTTTASDGQFNFTTSCVTGQQVYITISGGNSGAYSSNPQILELAGLGACGSLPAYVNVNEVMTVASAYALGNFMSIDGTGFVHISAPAGNNNTGTGTTTAAAGLAHAFLNIPSLVNYQYGTANSTVPNGRGGGSVGYVPAAEINSIANALYTCVNSNGSSAGASTSTDSFTTPSSPTSGAGASSTLTASSLTDLGSGSIKVTLAGVPVATFSIAPQVLSTGLTALSTLFNDLGTLTSTNSVTTPTASKAATGTIKFASPSTSIVMTGANNIQGTLNLSYASGTPVSITIPAGTTTVGLAALINASAIHPNITALATSSVTVGLTGAAVGSTNTIAFSTGTAITDVVGLTSSVASNVLTLTGPVGTANTLSISGGIIENTDTSTCGPLFSATPNLSGVLPTNTLQAAMNLAKNPWVSVPNVTALYNLSTPQPAFTPALSAAPTDWNIAITYSFPVYPTGCATTCASSSYPKDLSLDVNDNVYVANDDVLSADGTNVYAFTSNGYNTYINQGLAAVSGATFVRAAAVDNAGNFWAMNPGHVYQVATATGNVTTTISECQSQQYGIAVDRANNVWTTGNTGAAASSNICELPASTSTAIDIDYTATASANGQGGFDVAVDAGQNIWFAEGLPAQNAGTSVWVLPNVGTVTSPSYNTTQSATVMTGTGFSVSGLNTSVTGGGQPAGIAIDSSGNGWTGTENTGIGLFEITPTFATSPTTEITALPSSPTASYTNSGWTSLVRVKVDGAGVIWTVDPSTTGPNGLITSSSTFIAEPGGLRPCVQLTVGATTCADDSGAINHLQIDSTGSIWLLNSASSTAYLFQEIGVAAPTWPWLGTGKPGQMPQ